MKQNNLIPIFILVSIFSAIVSLIETQTSGSIKYKLEVQIDSLRNQNIELHNRIEETTANFNILKDDIDNFKGRIMKSCLIKGDRKNASTVKR